MENEHSKQKSLLEGTKNFVSRILSRDTSTDCGSWRANQCRKAGEVPFGWEAKPGKPKELQVPLKWEVQPEAVKLKDPPKQEFVPPIRAPPPPRRMPKPALTHTRFWFWKKLKKSQKLHAQAQRPREEESANSVTDDYICNPIIHGKKRAREGRINKEERYQSVNVGKETAKLEESNLSQNEEAGVEDGEVTSRFRVIQRRRHRRKGTPRRAPF